MTYTHEEVEEAFRNAHELIEEWRNKVATLRIELHGSVPEAVFDDHVRLEMRERYPEEWDALDAAQVKLDCIRGDMELRMVEAHEWLKNLRETADN